MTDLATNVGAIQAWIANVQSTFTSIPETLSDSASPADFGNVLAEMQQALTGVPAGSPSAALSSTAAPAPSAGSTAAISSGAQVVSAATAYLGVPYQWGGTTPSGFDCSGFTQYVYGQLGISLPRTSEQQATVGTAVDSITDAQPGDLVFYAGSDGTASSPGHVGIYLGNNEMIDAPQTGQDVSIQAVGSPVAIRRLLNPSTSAQLASLTSAAASTNSTTPVPSSLAPMFISAAGTYGVPAQLLTSVARVESNFDPNAASSAGAQGLMQLMPQTASGLGVNPLDPQQAINGAAQLLGGYLKQFGSVPLALAAYNAGAGAVQQYAGIPPYPQTAAYIGAVMQGAGLTSAGTVQ